MQGFPLIVFCFMFFPFIFLPTFANVMLCLLYSCSCCSLYVHRQPGVLALEELLIALAQGIGDFPMLLVWFGMGAGM